MFPFDTGAAISPQSQGSRRESPGASRTDSESIHCDGQEWKLMGTLKDPTTYWMVSGFKNVQAESSAKRLQTFGVLQRGLDWAEWALRITLWEGLAVRSDQFHRCRFGDLAKLRDSVIERGGRPFTNLQHPFWGKQHQHSPAARICFCLCITASGGATSWTTELTKVRRSATWQLLPGTCRRFLLSYSPMHFQARVCDFMIWLQCVWTTVLLFKQLQGSSRYFENLWDTWIQWLLTVFADS